MCYSTALDREAKALEARYHKLMIAESKGELPFYWTNAFARPWWPVITTENPDRFTWLQWGLIPPFAIKDPKTFLGKTPTFNAVSEEAEGKRSFKDPWEKGYRCLIPVTGFYEYQTCGEGKKAVKVPHYVTMPGSVDGIFSLLGLYEPASESYTVLTTKANNLMDRVHNLKHRQPCHLPKDIEQDWINPNLTNDEVKALCAESASHEWLASITVKIDRTNGNTPESMKPHTWAVIEEEKQTDLFS